jgi:hypothetical protein
MNTDQLFEHAKGYLGTAIWTNLPEGDRVEAQKLLDLLATTRAPASTSASKHGAFVGGLMVHAYCVFRIGHSMLQGINEHSSLLAADIFEAVPDRANLANSQLASCSVSSLLKASIIHDLNKVIGINGNPYYVPNMLKSGKQSDVKPWEISDLASPVLAIRELLTGFDTAVSDPLLEFLHDGLIDYREGLVSLAVAKMYAPVLVANLTKDERNAIIFHDGAYAGRTGIQESMLQIILHSADMLASRYFC